MLAAMWNLLSSIFESRHSHDDPLADQVLTASIEKAIDKTDPRLRALGTCHKRLQDPVKHALGHVFRLVDQLSGPIDVSPDRYGQDPLLRALFLSSQHMREILGRFRSVRDYLGQHTGIPPENIYGLLSVVKREKRVLGMELVGDTVRRDVLQVAVSFEDHQYLAPSESPEAARTKLIAWAYDSLLENALETIAAQKIRRGKLIQKRQLLRGKLLSSVSDPSLSGEYAALEADIAMIEEELGHINGIELSLGESLEIVRTVLNEAEQWLSITPYQVDLDYRNIKQSTSSNSIELSEISSLNGLRRMVVFSQIPYQQLPEPRDLLIIR